jgi:hypothetical protein
MIRAHSPPRGRTGSLTACRSCGGHRPCVLGSPG